VKAVKLVILVIAVLAAQSTLSAADRNDKNKDKVKAAARVADSGSFGIYLNGKRVGTETFNITETLNNQHIPDYSTATSEIKFDDGRFRATQTAEMQVSAKGELRSYVKLDVQHMLPLSTIILDDNFFSQREILLWWYLSTCRRQDNNLLCGTGKFMILVPHQHVSGNATLELMGQEKVMIKGAERELNKIKLDTNGPQALNWLNDQSHESEAAQWVLWVDDQYRIIKMTVAGSNVEVVRD
jgi:hypothetical protein